MEFNSTQNTTLERSFGTIFFVAKTNNPLLYGLNRILFTRNKEIFIVLLPLCRQNGQDNEKVYLLFWVVVVLFYAQCTVPLKLMPSGSKLKRVRAIQMD